MAMVKWLLETVDLAARAEEILALGDGNYTILDRTPQDIAAGWPIRDVCLALTGRGTKATFEYFARATQRSCATCIMSGVVWDDVDEQQHQHFNTHCPKWSGPDVDVCRGWIGPDDTVAIPTGYGLGNRFARLDIEAPGDGLMRDMDVYVDGVRRAAALREEQQEGLQEMALERTRREIQQFVDWQAFRPTDDLQHFQSHTCTRCKHWLGPKDLGAPACLFQVDPLTRDFNGEAWPPSFGVLVGQDGRLLPRCEAYISRNQQATTKTKLPIKLPEPDRVLNWLKLMRDGRARRTNDVLWAPLQWLDYGHQPASTSWWGPLRKYLQSNWYIIGSRGIALLIDTLVYDLRLMDSFARGTKIELFHPVTHEVETWVPLGFEYLTGGHYPSYYDWPEDWPKPWEDPENLIGVEVDADADGSE
jgi:hypothetical protein